MSKTKGWAEFFLCYWPYHNYVLMHFWWLTHNHETTSNAEKADNSVLNVLKVILKKQF